jgi:hypothetical protein
MTPSLPQTLNSNTAKSLNTYDILLKATKSGAPLT